MPIIAPPPRSTTIVVQSLRTISTTGGTTPVTGWNGNPAVGRTILLLGKNVWGNWAVIAQTITDGDGNYSFTVPAGERDRFVVVGIGAPEHGEYTRALGELEGVA